MASISDECDDIISQTSEVNYINYEDFVRHANPGEPDRCPKNNRRYRYCTFDGCTYKSEVVTNMRGHLSNEHHLQNTTTTSEVRRVGAEQLQELWDLAEPRTREDIQNTVFEAYLDRDVVRKALVRLIVQQRLAFSIVESPCFHAFVQALNPLADDNIIPASHSTIRTAIQSHWFEEKLILQREIQTATSKINISLDIWTSPNRILFIAVVAHFVRRSNGTAAKSLLALRQVAGHSGEEQFIVLRTILLEYEIAQNLGVIIGDNATTNDTLCRTICKWYSDKFDILWDPEHNRVRCLGHIINLIVQAFIFAGTSAVISLAELQAADKDEEQGLEPDLVRASTIRFIGPMGKLHNIVVHIRGSGLRTKEFIDKAHRIIPLDNRTRWNSWYHMIMIALELEMHVDFYVKNQPDLKEDTLERADWDMLRTIRTFLKQFKDIVLENEGDSKSLGQSLPSLFILRTHIKAFQATHEKEDTDFSRDCVVRAKAAFAALQKWWDLLWKHPVYQIATVLHPYYRTNFVNIAMQRLRVSIKDQKTKREWIKQIWLDWRDEHEDSSYEGSSTTKPSQEQGKPGRQGKEKRKVRRTTAQIAREAQDRSIEGMMERVFGGWTNEIIDEWDTYIGEPATKGVKDVLKWWQDDVRHAQFPLLSRFALEIYSIPPMSDEPERVFSGGRRTISWERSKLNPDTIEVVECLHHWVNQRTRR